MSHNVNLTMSVDAVNAAQLTPYKCNPLIAGVIDETVQRDLDVPYYRKPIDKPTLDEASWRNPELAKRMKHELREWHASQNASRHSRISLRAALANALKYRDRRLWLPMQTIKSGRMHYKPTLSPQASKTNRSMLDFAEGMPIANDTAVEHAMATVADLWPDGLTVEQADRCVADPLRHDDWMHGEAPFMRLRAAQMLSAFHAHGLGYVDHMVHYRDQTCSGPAHYAALLRDDTLAPHVDLTDDDTAPDLYTKVAELAVTFARTVGTEVADAVARKGITRADAKRVVMPLGYGARHRSVENATIQHVFGAVERGDMQPPYPDLYRYSLCLTQCLWQSAQLLMSKPFALQKWLGEVAAQAAREQVVLRWVSPSGFPVASAEWQKRTRKIQTHIGQTVYVPVVLDDTDTMDARAMRQQVPPLFVHSFEAAYLSRVVSYARDLVQPITNVSLIHDSIGVHAACLEDMLDHFGPLKQAWLHQYKPDHLHQIAECFQGQLADDLPPLPEYGTHKIEEVLNSGRYFQV